MLLNCNEFVMFLLLGLCLIAQRNWLGTYITYFQTFILFLIIYFVGVFAHHSTYGTYVRTVLVIVLVLYLWREYGTVLLRYGTHVFFLNLDHSNVLHRAVPYGAVRLQSFYFSQIFGLRESVYGTGTVPYGTVKEK